MSDSIIGYYDPSKDIDSESTKDINSKIIDIRIQQRNARKTITTVEGIDTKFDLKRLKSAFATLFCCNCALVKGSVIQLQGDQRTNVADFLIAEGLSTKECIKIHGF